MSQQKLLALKLDIQLKELLVGLLTQQRSRSLTH